MIDDADSTPKEVEEHPDDLGAIELAKAEAANASLYD